MFTVYYANQLENQKDLLVNIIRNDPNPNPFEQETILVQSTGMEQWLQMQLSSDLGVAAHFQFPYPTTFLWQQYRLLFPELPKENSFDRHSMLWRLMRLIPQYLDNQCFAPLKHYLNGADQLKLYQLCTKIADLFDQYLVYRPEWLIEWEKGNLNTVKDMILNRPSFKKKEENDIFAIIEWQSFLWVKLIDEIKSETSEILFNTSHRAYLQQRYFDKLDNLSAEEKLKLPKRIFIFGISSLPNSYFLLLHKLSQYCHIHLFFTNPSQYYWGNNQEAKLIEKLALKQQLSSSDLADLYQHQGNKLLSAWGKQGKEFLNLLIEADIQSVDFYTDYPNSHLLLNQIKNAILNFEQKSQFSLDKSDKSVQIHSCHSKMREIEVLHNQLLNLFEADPDLSPKDIIVMSPDIDSYAPYIEAVFSRYTKRDEYNRNDSRFIPFSLSDQKISYIDPIIKSFFTLLSLKENRFIAEDILDLLNVKAIQNKYLITNEQYMTLRQWIRNVGIRAGLNMQSVDWLNYNSWQNGLERLLLGSSLKEEHNSWQNTLAFNESYGLSAEIAGKLAKFIDDLTAWFAFIQKAQTADNWLRKLTEIIALFYQEDEENLDIILTLNNAVETIIQHISNVNFTEEIEIGVIQQLMEAELNEQRSNLNFLSGKVNFCTLLPMRAIPFKVVCLLGMNEGEFPRQQNPNPFDLMQYAPIIGDRARRDDDRYLFLEALLSAQSIFYVSYLGQSLTDNNAKLPSLLVSQLMDYINQNLIENHIQPINHPMTVFSQKYYQADYISYDQEWLEIKRKYHQNKPFLTAIHQQQILSEIDMTDLIYYIQDPLKYFFHHQLGVKFENYDESIDETEIFSLSHLERYQLLDEIVNLHSDEVDHFFKNETLKGKLPINAFGVMAELELKKAVSMLQATLTNYQIEQNNIIEIEAEIDIISDKVKLVGNIDSLFEQDFIQWRVGKLRDKDLIHCWIYYLVMIVSDIPFSTFKFYYLEDSEVKSITFTPISKANAALLLGIYIQDYLASFQTLKWAITQHICRYIQDYTAETSPAYYCQTATELIQSPYLDRVFAQTADLDWEAIHQRTFNWFAPMIQHFIEEEE
ncbi:exodeoxyribonuclease V subunit gamma [Muribacter muris]|uniref:RecBCD enzyme subunit RecC n=1 Tax=Muribacter muris TaxID=67855 RepID=A0A4Y9K2G3_9PAST|nr:exodeoxyribonuclease V subunit gamma [Muribacter muris]MBF0784948.1 exodeoxyribonuclease V subunit gamma [Muribacter muris]MBF0827256.1 exodeoxyribonuclease V subunit gamma [Muribacter muris]TFV10866.1 exodeoxyribonuclease V subunit gamma [Muribacter muris]